MHSPFINRCLELAENGSGYTAPNPMVGAVVVFENRIIGEGYHHSFGESHAEVNAINDAIANGHESLLEKSTLYVSLEPCNHHGKTPPCTELIIRHRIPHVVIGCLDPFPEVNGTGNKRLKDAGVKVEVGIMEDECKYLNRRFFTFYTRKRPFVLLKFARTQNHFLASVDPEERKISNEKSDILVHKWRSEESAIMVGTRTAIKDNPSLTVRKWKGKNPIRVLLDRDLRIPSSYNLYDDSAPTIVLNSNKNEDMGNVSLVRMDFKNHLTAEILRQLYERKILSVMVEGGSTLLKQFIEHKLWDEARIITSSKKFEDGIKAPEIEGDVISRSDITGDEILVMRPE